MATRPKAVIESRNGEKFSPITIAKNVLTDDGQNLHDILSNRKEDMMTPTIENSSSMFKVGQGDDVDYSSNIVNGAYESMVLKGKTMVNCIQESSSQDVVLPYEFEEGQYVTINDTKESGALGVELKGQTLVNTLIYEHTSLLSGATRSDDTITLNKSQQWSRIHLLPSNSLWTPNETYTTILYDVVGDTSTLHMCSQNGAAVTKTPFTNNKAVFTMGTGRGTNQDNRLGYIESSTIVANETVSFKVVILKGNYSDVDVPYFTGMASCKMPTLHTVGSLFDAHKIIPNNAFTYSHSTNIGRFEFTNRGDVVANTSIQLPAGTYDISFLIRGVCDNGRVAITFAKDGQAWHACSRVEFNYGQFGSTTFKEVKSQRTFDAPVTVTIVGHAWAGGATGSGWCEFKDIRFTPVGKTSILSLPEEVVLRSLPNGVCDTFNTRTGVYTQRIWSATFNGAESYSVWESSVVAEGMAGIYTRTKVNDKIVTSENQDGQILCDTLPTTHRNQLASCQYDSVVKGNNYIGFTMKGKTSEEIKQWLSENPTTVYCELKTPIIKKINLPSTLKSWNTTTHIYSEIPDNTLYPILTHLNPTYPVILKPSTKYSIVANSYSNGHTNSAINFNLGGATASTTVGNRVTTITTPSTLTSEELVMSGRGNKLNNVMVIEGDVVGDEPYFEGICDCKSPILSNVGKNLINALNCSVRMDATILSKEQNCITFKAPKAWAGLTYHLNLKPNTTYTFSFEGDSVDTRGYVRYKTGMNSWSDGYGGSSKHTFTTDGLGVVMFTIESATIRDVVTVKNIMIEEDTTKNLYEPHKSNTITFDQKDSKTIVLRSLPNGVCDTLNVETGEYVQRIGEIVFDGSEDENWKLNNTENTTTKRFIIGNFLIGSNVTNDWNGANKYVCDKLNKYLWSDTVEFGITVIDNSVFLYNNNIDYSIGALKTWLAQNPITVQYELATPIVSTVDIQGFPYAYTNGHVQLSSGHSGQSLIPKVEYSVITNRNGQICSNQKMVERHQKQLDRLQAIILTNLVNTQYEQTLTNLKYDLKNVREEVK